MTAEPSGPLTVEQVGHLVRNFLSSPATFPMEVVTERLNALLAPILAAREAAARKEAYKSWRQELADAQEEMRERCAQAADLVDESLAAVIRALPLAGADAKEGGQK